MEFDKLIKQARKAAGLNQTQAANAWGVNVRALQQWESGRRKPTGENALKLWPHIQAKEPQD